MPAWQMGGLLLDRHLPPRSLWAGLPACLLPLSLSLRVVLRSRLPGLLLLLLLC